MNVKTVGEGKVVLIAGAGKCYTDVAARFVRSERPMEEIIASPYDENIVNNIVNSGHKAGVEFDYFLFGVEGYSRVTEIQLVRKRLASYMIKSGRAEKGGKRSFDMIIPEAILNHTVQARVKAEAVRLPSGVSILETLGHDTVDIEIGIEALLATIEEWYDSGVEKGLKEEELRYLKPQATEWKGLIGMNAHALLDWFQIRTCKNAQTEIRDLATKMLKLCKEAQPSLFQNAGPSCKNLGYCPENDFQHPECRGKVYTKDNAISILKEAKRTDRK